MGTVSTPINAIQDTTRVPPYSSLHLPTTVLPSAIPQDVALISVQGVQRGETDTLFGHSTAQQPLATLNAAPATPVPTPTSAPATPGSDGDAAASAAPDAQSPQQQLGAQQLDSIRALYSSRSQPPPIFSVIA